MNAIPKAGDAGVRTVRWAALDEDGRAAVLRRPTQDTAQSVREGVAAILAEVRAGGDDALRALTARLDRAEVAALQVDEAAFAAAEAALDPALKEAILDAAERIERFHAEGGARAYAVETAPGVECRRVVRPIRRVGL